MCKDMVEKGETTRNIWYMFEYSDMHEPKFP